MRARDAGPSASSGECEIDLVRREVRVGGARLPVGGRAFEILETLVRAAGRLVTKEELIDRVWPGAIVSDNTLQVHISTVRKALGAHRALVKTDTGRGYRLLGDWTVRDQASASTPPATPQHPQASYAEVPSTNLPVLATGLVGRSTARQRLRDLVSAYRVVTLTGPGGIGKTVLALQVARDLLDDFAGGSRFVELGSLSDPDLVPSTLAAVLGLQLGGGEITAETIARAVGEKHLLLILDNCEHLVAAVAGLAERLLRLCPRMTLLATSREVLRVEGECVYRVSPLDVSAPEETEPNQIRSQSAVELFIARASALDQTFSPHSDTLFAIATICRHLDGIPLAIEFAATRAAMLGVQQVASGLGDRFALLTRGRRTALPRQRTLRAMLDWSYDLLPEEERSLLRRLAIFLSGFTLDAAAAVMEGSVRGALGIVEGISNLVAKSLINLDRTDGASRWKLLETVRAYALEKLTESGEIDDAAQCSAAYFCSLCAPPPPGSKSRLSNDELTLRAREIDNVRAALDWCFSAGGNGALGVDLTAAYAPVWLHLSLMQECREQCERALRGAESGSASHLRLQMWLQIDLAVSLFVTMGTAEQANDLLTGALDAALALGDLDAQAGALANLVANHIFRAELGKARAAAGQLGQVAGRIGDPAIIRMADRLMGTALVLLGRPREGQRFLEKFLEAHPVTADRERPIWYPADHRAAARAFLARALWVQGFLDKAFREAQTSLADLEFADHQLLHCRVLYFGMCRIASSTGNFAAAEQSIARLIEAATSLNAPFWQTAGRLLAGKLMIERGDFGRGVLVLHEALHTCRRTGWRLSYPEFNGALATGLAGLERIDEALDAVNEGLTAAAQGEDGHDLYLAEALRIKGEILLRQEAPVAAEACFCEALELARQQQALFWELRVALALARMRLAEDRGDAGRALLAPVYDRFSEGFAAPDLRAARAILEGLPP